MQKHCIYSIVQILRLVRFLFKKLIILDFFFQQGHIKLIKSGSKDMYDVEKYISFSNTVYTISLTFLFIKESARYHKYIRT